MMREIDVLESQVERKESAFLGDTFSEQPMLEMKSEAETNSLTMSSLMTNPCFNNCAITFNVNVDSKK